MLSPAGEKRARQDSNLRPLRSGGAALYPLSYGRLGLRELSVAEPCGSRSSPTPTCRAATARSRACVARLRAADAILHAGDFMRRSRCCDELQAHRAAGASRARQRRRRGAAARCCRERAWSRPSGARIAHGPRRRAAAGPARAHARALPDADAVVFGHSHLPLHEADADGFQIFNPAARPSAAAPRGTRWASPRVERRARATFELIALEPAATGHGPLRSSSPAPPARCPTARRGLPALLRARAAATGILFDCGEGTQRQLAALGRPAGARRDLHHPLPRRPLARAARHAQDVRPARARAAARPSTARRACSELFDAHAAVVGRRRYPLDAGRARARTRRSRCDGYVIAAVPGRPPRARRYGYAFVEDDRPGRFDAEAARALGVTPGPGLRPPAARARRSTASRPSR